MAQETMERSFAVGAPARLSVANIAGRVDIRPGEDGTVSITAVKRLTTGNAEGTEIELAQRDDGSVVVATRFRKLLPKRFGWNRPCEVDYAVRVPRHCALRVQGVSNSGSIQDLSGEFSLSTVSGPLRMQDLSGRIEISGVSAELVGERLRADGVLRLQTVSGDAVLTESTLPAIVASTISGHLTLHTTAAEGPYRLDSVSGDIRLMVPASTAFVVEGHSMSGRVRTAMPVVLDARGHRAGLPEGGPRVRLSSVSGDLWILPIDADGADTAPPSAAATKAGRMAILERVASGEITVGEALATMRA